MQLKRNVLPLTYTFWLIWHTPLLHSTKARATNHMLIYLRLSSFEAADNILACIVGSIVLAAIMTGSVQLFQAIQNYHQTLGICQPQPNASHPINWRMLVVFFCFAEQIASATVFFLTEAKTVLDYGCSFYTSISMVYCVYYFLILIQRTPQIFQLIEHFQEFIEQSECSMGDILFAICFLFFMYSLS